MLVNMSNTPPINFFDMNTTQNERTNGGVCVCVSLNLLAAPEFCLSSYGKCSTISSWKCKMRVANINYRSTISNFERIKPAHGRNIEAKKRNTVRKHTHTHRFDVIHGSFRLHSWLKRTKWYDRAFFPIHLNRYRIRHCLIWQRTVAIGGVKKWVPRHSCDGMVWHEETSRFTVWNQKKISVYQKIKREKWRNKSVMKAQRQSNDVSANSASNTSAMTNIAINLTRIFMHCFIGILTKQTLEQSRNRKKSKTREKKNIEKNAQNKNRLSPASQSSFANERINFILILHGH